MNVALYARVSSPRQQQAQTIEQQLERLRAHVADHGDWHLDEQHIYRDDGYSGAQLNRPDLDRLRDHAAFAAFELVLITAPDWLARSFVHIVTWYRRCLSSTSPRRAARPTRQAALRAGVPPHRQGGVRPHR